MSAIADHIARLQRGGTPPPRTTLQRLTALERANDIRTYRAQLKKDVKAGRVDVCAVLVAGEHDPRLVTMKVFELLLAAPKYGRVKANAALRRCSVSPSKTIGGLSGRQRGDLVRVLRDRDARPTLFDDPLAAPLRARTQPPAAAVGVRSRTAASGADR